jgi:hypothetical protein
MAQGIRYQPYKYQESYIPMEVLPAVDQALGYHQQRYDVTEGQLANMYKDLYDRQIYDPQAFNAEMEAIKSKVEDIDKQYKGDLSAGMNDYIRLIGKAKQSPFWKTNELLNKELERQQSLTEQLQAQGRNVLSFKTLPKSATIVDKETGQKRYLRPDEIKFDLQGQLDYTEEQGKLWDKALHEESTKGKLPTEMLGKTPFIEIAKGRGITNTQVLNKAAYILRQYKDTDEYKQQKRALMELQGLSSDVAEKHIAEDILDTGKSRRYYSDDSQIVHDTQYGKNKNQDKPSLVPLYNVSDKVVQNFDLNSLIKESSNTNTYKGQIKEKALYGYYNENPVRLEEDIKKISGFRDWEVNKTDKSAVKGERGIVRDSKGNIDVNKTLRNIETVSNNDPAFDTRVGVAKQFIKNRLQAALPELGKIANDIGAQVVGFDVDDVSSKSYEQMQSLVDRATPEKFNFETGRFADIKSNKLAENKEFLKVKKDKQFKIQGYFIANNKVKFVAEDGSGEQQIVNVQDKTLKNNLVRLFGDETAALTDKYSDHQFIPGDSYYIIDPDTKKEEKRKYPNNITREVNGIFYDSRKLPITYANGQPVDDPKIILETFKD